jgi:hypothetical protein
MKYCIGCKHLNFDSGEHTSYGSEWTGEYGGEDAQFACALGHWKLPIELEETKLVDITSNMEKAETCQDFSERTTTEPT